MDTVNRIIGGIAKGELYCIIARRNAALKAAWHNGGGDEGARARLAWAEDYLKRLNMKLTDQQVNNMIDWDHGIKWTWNGQEVHGAYVHYISKDMGPVEAPYLFAGVGANGARLWTRDKGNVAVFSSDMEARKFIERTFTLKEQQKLLICREG